MLLTLSLLMQSTGANNNLEQAEKLFRQLMKEQGFRCTNERIAVLHELYNAESHLDADELYVLLKQKHVAISRATVYHTLHLLFKFRLISKIDLGHKHAHYEKAYGVTNHLHMVCSICGRVTEVDDNRIAPQLQEICRHNGLNLEHFSLQLVGTCIKHDSPIPTNN
uniref:Ferric uptake regulation protein n=1 Tax=Chlorobium chlorochromatii (strain CaD3) TaxID=340177 RepID=Q3AP45_CHLCH